MWSHVLVRRRMVRPAHLHVAERLEARRLLCAPLDSPPDLALERRPGVVLDTPEEIADFLAAAKPAPATAEGGPEVAPIVWWNRGITTGADDDRFDDIFGAGAEAARIVFDAAINMWARVIGNFNYGFPFGGSAYQLRVQMATTGTGNGASASVTSWAWNKPIAGSITMGRGGGGTGGDWFIDPTPYDNSEFMGTIQNAFAGDAQVGSPARDRGDFLTVALAELAHCFGLYWAPSGFQSFTTDTNINDAAGGSTGADLYTFDSGNIDHLVTEFDSGGGATGSAVHTADPQSIFFAGQTWNGTEDAGNAWYEFSRRYLVPENLRLIFNDSLGYSTLPAADTGTFYATMSGSTLRIRGSEGTDFIVISASGGNLVVSVDPTTDVAGSGHLAGAGNLPAWVSAFSASSVGSILIEGNGGQDFLRLEGNLGKNTTISGGDGDDFIDFSYHSRNLDAITGGTTVRGDSGNDYVYVYDSNNTANDTFTITDARFDRPFWAGFYYDGTVEGETLIAGTGVNTINIQSTYTGQPVYINNAGGADTVNIGSTNGVQGIRAQVQIQNDPSFTTLNINDGPDATARTATFEVTSGFGYVEGLAPATIFWDSADIAAINVTTGSGVDTVHVIRNTQTLNINSTGGNDVVNLGSPAAAGLQGINGPVTIDNSPAFSVVTIDDTGNAFARTVTIDEAGGYNTVSGLAPALIRFDSVDVLSATIRTGGVADTVNLLRNDEVLTLTSAGGGDTVNVGNGTNGVQGITGPVTITNPPSFTTINVNNSADVTGRVVTHDTVSLGGSNFGRIAGLAPAVIEYRYGDTASITITTGVAPDTVNVLRNGALTTVNSAGGGDIVNVGNGADGVQSILATLQVRNSPSFSQVTLDDAADAVARTVTIENFTIAGDNFGRITGLAPAEINYRVIDISSAVTIQGGGGGDTFFVRSLDSARGVAINGNGGADTFHFGDAANRVEPIDGFAVVNGGSGSDRLLFNDQGEALAVGFAVNPTTVAKAGMGSVTYGGLEGIVLNSTGGAGKTHTIDGTAAGTPVTINGSGGTDTINANETSSTGPVVLPGSGGADTVNVNPDNAGLARVVFTATQRLGFLGIGTGARADLSAGGSLVLTTGLLVISPTGRLDVADDTVIVDYTGPSPIGMVGSYLASGYAGGSWSGDGINSSIAAVTAIRSVGYAEATDLFTTFPAAFAGQSIDSTSVLIRYTLPGDASLDRAVNIADFSLLASNFNQSPRRWSQGNFNYDAGVSIADFSLLAASFNLSAPAESVRLFGNSSIRDLIWENEPA